MSTIRLGHEIYSQLVCASRKARKRWVDNFQIYKDEWPVIQEKIRASQHTFTSPLAQAFVLEWAQNLGWALHPSGSLEAIGVQVPFVLLAELKELGEVESFEFILGDRAQVCCASLGNNDHNRAFGLIVNYPVWIELASHEKYVNSFEKQLGLVIHHEMAHFCHQQTEARSELHAQSCGESKITTPLRRKFPL